MSGPPAPRPAPAFDRATGRITFPAAGEAAESLAEFLVARGVRAEAVENGAAVQLLGIPDLTAVEAAVREWSGGSSPTAVHRRLPAGLTGRVQAVDTGRGRAVVATDGHGYVVLDLLADRGLGAGDQVRWPDPVEFGVAVVVNATRGTRLKVYVVGHGLSPSQATGRMAAE